MSVSDLMGEGYFARSHLTGSGMACEFVAVLLQGTFLASLVVAAGVVSVAVADLGGGIIFTSGIGVGWSAMYSDVIGLWSLSNMCACKGWMDS